MNIVILNPNSTQSMTDDMAKVAAETVAAMTGHHNTANKICIKARTNVGAPAAIQGPVDAQAAIAGMLRMVEEYTSDDSMAQLPVDSIIIGCADDVGLHEIHELVEKRCGGSSKKKKPTILGITQAASIASLCLLAPNSKFAIVTTVPQAVPVLERNLQDYGTHTRCAGVWAANVPVLDLEQKPQESLARLFATIKQALDQGASAIILGCAGMSPLRSQMQKQFPSLLFLDGVQAATRIAVAMCDYGQ